MAEQSVCEGKSLEDLERDITCAVCQEHYTEPKVLPCLHYYCKQCILKLAHQTGSNKSFPCPTCRSEAKLPEGGVDELKTAFFVHHLKSAYTMVGQLHGKVEVKCEACTSEYMANSFCRKCALFICDSCVESHQKMKNVFKGHEVVSIQDLKEGRMKADATLKETTVPLKCMTHKKSLKLYCFDCDLLICQHCTLKDHRDHNFDFNVVTAPMIKKELMKLLEPLKKESDSLSKAMGKVVNAKDEVKAQGTYVTNTILTSFKKFLDKVKKFEEELISNAEQKVEAKIELLLEQEKTLSMALAEVQSVVDYTERCVRHCDDYEVMSMHVEVQHRIEQDTKDHCKPSKSKEPVTEADMGVEVRCVEALQQLLKTSITQLAINPAQSMIQDKGILTAEVNELANTTMTAKTTNSKKKTAIVGQLKSLYDGSVVDCIVQQVDHNKYDFNYTPIIRGHHELTITVDGQHIAGSPFSVFVSIHPTKLGHPVKVWNDLPKVVNIAFNSHDEAVVLKQNDDMLLFYKDGEKIRSISAKKLSLDNGYVVGLDVDDEDNIYITAYNSLDLLKFNKDGHILKKVQFEDTTKQYFDATLLENEIMICTNKAVEIHNKELEYVRTIAYEDMGQLHCVSTDLCGNIYATDGSTNCVQVLSRLGDFLRSFPSNKDGQNSLARPMGICVRDQLVYVSSGDLHNVSVFTTEGEHVTTFGRYGAEEGAFNAPRGISLDKHGFVYVCDKCNDRIQIF